VERYLIIGGGVAAARAAEAVGDLDTEAEVVVVSEETEPFYRRPQLRDVLAGRLSAARIMSRPGSSLDERRIRLVAGNRVAAFDPAAHEVTLADGSGLDFTRALIATGKRALPRSIEGTSLPGLNSMRTLSEIRRVAGQPQEDEAMAARGGERTAVVYGDTLLALEAVQGLLERGFSTTYLVSGSRLVPALFDDIASAALENRLQAAGAQIVMQAEVTAVLDRDGRSGGYVTREGSVYEASVVCYCDDYEPALGFLCPGDSLVVGPSYATAWDDVFAAGDVISPRNYMSYLQAWRGGAAAGALMAGGEETVRSPVPMMNWRVCGLSLAAVGLTVVGYRSGYGEMRGGSSLAPGGLGDYYKKLVFDPDDVLVGAFLLGNVAEAGALEEAVREGRHKKQLDAGMLKQMFEVTLRTQFRGVECPVCRHEMQLEPGAAAGDRAVCPVCGVEFELEQAEHGFRAVAV
jgi:NAD(P)H-nitrite reductase large subunit